MKNLVLPFLVLLSLPSFAQLIVSGVNVNEIDSVNTISVKVDGAEFSLTGLDVSLDYGQKNKKSTTRIMNKTTGDVIKFNSPGHVINHLENNGWQHYDSQIARDRSFNTFYYYFRRKL